MVADTTRSRVLTLSRGAARWPTDIPKSRGSSTAFSFSIFSSPLSKIALGYYTGAVSILSDGFHSLTDSASNVVALVGVSVARRPPDANHPYGHRKYETMASLGILVFLVVVLVEVLTAAADRLRQRRHAARVSRKASD